MPDDPTYPAFVKTDHDRKAYDVARAGGWKHWVKRPADLRAIENGCYFSIEHALYVKQFFESVLRIAPHKPFVLYPWQWDLIAMVFGWRNKDGKRRFRKVYCEIPKKNGKSLLCSGLALYLLVGDKVYGAEVYNAASDRSQAEQVFKESAKMVANSPILSKRLRVINSTKRILNLGKGGIPTGFMRALSKDSFNAEGIKAHGLILDELHVWRDRAMFGALRYATIAKQDDAGTSDNSLMVMITTAGQDRKSIGWDEHETARKYLEDVLVEGYEDYFAVIYGADEKDDIQDPKTWYKANPALGKSLDEGEFRQAAQKAKNSKGEELIFRRYRLNQWVAGNIQGWLPMKPWMNSLPRTPLKDLLGKECWAGLDLSSTSDLTALVLVFPHPEGGFDLLPFIWCPEDTVIERTQRENVPYLTWMKTGLIETTPGNTVDYDFIRARVNEIAQQFNIREIALDRLWQGQALCNDLMADGLPVVLFGQGFMSMGTPSKLFEVLVRKGLIRHGGNPVMQWCASNCVASTDPHGNVKPDKKKSTEKIDPIVASIMAIGRATAGGDTGPSLSDAIMEQGLVVLPGR